MKIAVLGAGAMGSLYGAMLAEAGEDVWLVDVWADHIDAVNKSGLTISSDEGDRKVAIRAATDPAAFGPAEMVLVFVKSYVTAAAMRGAMALVGKKTMVLTLQNGVGNVEQLGSVVGRERVLAGTSGFGGTMLGAGHIRHAGTGDTMLGEITGERTPRLEELNRVFDRSGLRPKITDNVQGVLWTKLMVNVGINALTALTRVKNGQLLNIPELTILMEMAVGEALVVARQKGIRLIPDDPLSHVKGIARATGNNISSMRQDVERGRPTEIDVINGAVVREGAALGVPTPLNQVLTLLIKSLEKGNAVRE